MKKHSRQLRLQVVFFSAIAAMTALFLLVFIISFYRYFSDILVQQEIAALDNQAAAFQDQTDAEIRKMDSVSINMNYSSSLHHLLGDKNLNLKTISLSDFSDLCTTINGVDQKVDQINLYDFYGNIMRVGVYTTKGTYVSGENEIVDNIKVTGGSKVISKPYTASYLIKHSVSPEKYISLYRTYTDTYGNQIGAVETALRCKSIFRSITTYQNRNKNKLTVRIYTADGTCIYPYDEFPKESFSYFEALSGIDDRPYFINPDTDEKEVMTSAVSSYTGWTYVLVMPEDEILTPVYQMLRQLIFLGICLLAFGLFLSYWLSHMMIRPIQQFQEEVSSTTLSTLDRPTPDLAGYQYKELYELNQNFSSMRQKLKISTDELVETRKQEIKSRSMALQSQINPHFYYNSLASVIALAENDQPEEVIRMCRNLTKIMRYITNTNETVTVKEEIDYINQYLDCMKVRYQSSLNYIINIDPDVMNEKIPRLLIQPLVENAIKYGIDSEPPWGIAIHGYQKDNGWRIEVMDSGQGFSEEALQMIQDRIKTAQGMLGLPEMQINGMGTLNVYLRWHLYAGDTMIFELNNTEAGHAIVTIGRTVMACPPKSEEKETDHVL